MSVRLRLRRTGTRNKACFRIVATDKRSPRDGRFIEIIGYYDPRHQDEKIDLDRTEYWLSKGAQPSETVAAIIRRAKDGTSLKKEIKKAEPDVATKDEDAAPEQSADPADPESESDVTAEADSAEKSKTTEEADSSEEKAEANADSEEVSTADAVEESSDKSKTES